MFVFGGLSGATALGDLLVLDTRTAIWCRPRTSEPPRPRGNHAASIVGDTLIIFRANGDDIIVENEPETIMLGRVHK